MNEAGRAGPLFLIERTLQAALLVAVAKPADCLWGQRGHPGNLWSTDFVS